MEWRALPAMEWRAWSAMERRALLAMKWRALSAMEWRASTQHIKVAGMEWAGRVSVWSLRCHWYIPAVIVLWAALLVVLTGSRRM